jgi:glycosyltransferase involved in cell wall biosynthesis
MQPTLPFNGRVLFALHSCATFEPSGYAYRSIALIKGLEAAGVQVFPCTRPGYPWDLPKYRNVPPTAYVDHAGLRFRLASAGDPSITGPESAYIDAYANYLVDLARENGVSVIHAASNYLNGWAAAQAGQVLGLTSVYEVRGLWHLTRAVSEPSYATTEHYRYCERREMMACQQVDRVITLSDGLRRWLVERGVDERKISIVGNAAHPVEGGFERDRIAIRGRLGIADTATVIGYLGAFVEYEGLEDLLIAQANTPAALRPILLLVGGGQQEDSLRQLASSLGLGEAVVFAGRVPPSKVSAYYAAMDAVILPRRVHPLTRLVPAIKPFEALVHHRPLFVSPPLAEALNDTLPGGYQVLALETGGDLLPLLDGLRYPPPFIGVPTWYDRAAQLYALYQVQPKTTK